MTVEWVAVDLSDLYGRGFLGPQSWRILQTPSAASPYKDGSGFGIFQLTA